VKVDRGFVVTDEYLPHRRRGAVAIGDLTNGPWLAHKASHEGVMVAELIAGGHPHAVDPDAIAGCTYCHPQVASVGLTEAKAKEKGARSRSAASPSSAMARRSRWASRRA
jgi:dihydrolipoamide dehydrogenase